MADIELTVMHPVGLHARPAAAFVRMASSFPCEIKIRNLTAESPLVNAKSILSVLTLGVNQGHRVLVEANGEKAAEALEALRALIKSNFGENHA